MNEQERTELGRLKERQARLEADLKLLSGQLKSLEERLNRPETETAKESPAQEVVTRAQKAGVENRISTREAEAEAGAPMRAAAEERAGATENQRLAQEPVSIAPVAAPPVIGAARRGAPGDGQDTAPKAIPEPSSERMETGGTRCPATQEPKTSTTSPAPCPPTEVRSLEMRVGTYWLVRVGIVMVLTGLVFFGNLAYQNYISQLGPGGKVSLLYLASAMLLGAGWWWQRKAAQETLKNYAQVLFAGGLAALYFTTYAAHHFEPLRVIASGLLDGVLLLGCAGFMVWSADRQRSEVLALLAVGLAYYSSIITRVGSFTLYSNLVLTVAAVFFLVRNRWTLVSFGSLAASYAAYGFWRFFNGSGWQWASPAEGLWMGTYFLMSYWLVFTAAVFLTRHERFAGQNRASFLTLNNGAFFTMFLLTMMQVQQGGFWKFALIYGGVLLALAEAARRLLTAEPLAQNFYLTQGLLLVTLGFISKFAGLQLALVLATESVVLLLLGQLRRSPVLRMGAYAAAALAVAWGLDGISDSGRAGIYLGMGLGGLMLVNTVVAHRHTMLSGRVMLRPEPSYFTLLALAVWLAATWNNTAHEQFPLVLAAEGILFAFSVYLLDVPELSLFGLAYLFLAQVWWGVRVLNSDVWSAWWDPVLMLVLAQAMSFWWRRQTVLALRARADDPWPALDKVPHLGKNLVLSAGAYLAVSLAGGWEVGPAGESAANGLWLPIGLGALMLVDALLARREGGPTRVAILRLQPSYSALLALVVWLAVTWHHSTRQHFPLILAGEGLLLTWSIYLLRIPELSLLGQGYLVLAQAFWLFTALGGGAIPSWWSPALLLTVTLVLSHWWQKQKVLDLRPSVAQFWQGLYALAIVGVLYFWLGREVGAPAWLVVTSLLAVGLTAYGAWTRAWLLAACGQIFVVVSGVQFAWQLWEREAMPGWPFALAPMMALLALSLATVRWFQVKPETNERVRGPLLQLALVYRWVALVMAIWWVCEYIPARERTWVLGLIGLCVFLWAGWQRNREALLFSGVFTATGLVFFWAPQPEARTVYWADLGAILALLGQQQVARRLRKRYDLDARVQGAVILIGGLSLWLFLSRWVLVKASGFYLTASWSGLALALFAAGIALRERAYRWLGLGVLACALGRVVFLDVWKLEALYRILSFMALGVVLLVLGFIYNKYQEKLKEWL